MCFYRATGAIFFDMISYMLLIFTAFLMNLAVRLRYVRKSETIPAVESLVFAVVVYWATSWEEFFLFMGVLCLSQWVFSPLSFGVPKTKKHIRDFIFTSGLIVLITAVFSMIFGGLTYGIQTIFF